MPIDINWFREDKGGDVAKLRESQRRRGKPDSQVDAVIEADKQWRKLDFEVNQLNKQQNALSGATGKAKVAQKKANEAAEKAKKDGKWSEDDEKKLKADMDRLEEECKKNQEDVKIVQGQLEKAKADRDECKTKLQKLLNVIGNIVADDVPVSMNEDENKVVVVKGEKKAAAGKKLYHHELLYMIDGFEPDRGVTVAGHRAYFLKGPGVLLNQALINYGIQFLMKHKYTALQPPFFMKKDIMAETAQLEEFDEALYHVKGSDSEEFYLIATSEQPISAYHRGELLHETQLPLRYAGVSSCFRKEAGAHGKDVAGIFRIHQFEKVEQFVLCSPDKSWEMHEEMVKVSQEFYDSLGLSYQVISIVSGALNNAAAKKLDLEAWFPARGVYRELVSCSNCTDYQSRAMETKFSAAAAKKGKKKENESGASKYVHMLNATLCATERTICCLLENYQTEDGVKVPDVLKPFTGGIEFFPFVREMPKQWKENREKEEKEAAKTAGKTETK